MTGRAKQIYEQIARMDDLMDDLTDDELLQEVTEQGWDVAAEGRAGREALKRAQVLSGPQAWCPSRGGRRWKAATGDTIRRRYLSLIQYSLKKGRRPGVSPRAVIREPAEKRLAGGGASGGQEQPEAQSIVFVVDDDASLREALKSLLRSVGLRVEVLWLHRGLPEAQVSR